VEASVTFAHLIALGGIWLSASGVVAVAINHSASTRLDRHGLRIDNLAKEIHELAVHVVKQNGRIAALENRAAD